MEDDLLALSRRRRIYDHISSSPGTYLREMEKSLSLTVGDLEYHLGLLEKGELVTTHDDGKRKRYFVKGEVLHIDKELISFLRLRTPRRIVLAILGPSSRSFKELALELGISKSSLSFQLTRLVKRGILLREKVERESIFKVRDPQQIQRVLTTYQVGVLDKAANGYVDLWSKIGL